MEQMRIKHNETGRSMVEMLGVLAVVAVLSIGGVAGYRYAVDKMNANEIINELKKRAITASQQRVSGQDTINLKEYYPNDEVDMIRNMYEVAVEPSYQNNEGFFALEVYDLPKGICRQILRSDWSMPVATELNEIVINDGAECNEGDDNKILFAFSNALGGGDANGGGGAGRPPVDPNNECAQNDTTPLRDRSGNCHSCNESDIINIKDGGDCSVCDGSRGAKRYVASVMGLRGKACVLASDCPEGSVPNDQTGYCDCPEGQIMTWWGNKCLPCDKAVETEENGLLSVLEDNAVSVCAVCGWEATKEGMEGDPNGTRQCIIPESSVPPEVSGVVTVTETESTVTETGSISGSEETISGTPEVSVSLASCFNTDKGCIPCDSLEGIGGDDHPDCSVCGSMRSTSYGNNCWLTTCPEGYMHDFGNFGTCIPCSQMEQAYNSDSEDGGTMTQMFISECQACGGEFSGESFGPCKSGVQ